MIFSSHFQRKMGRPKGKKKSKTLVRFGPTMETQVDTKFVACPPPVVHPKTGTFEGPINNAWYSDSEYKCGMVQFCISPKKLIDII